MEEDIDEWFKLQTEKLEKQFLKEVLVAVNSGEHVTIPKEKYIKVHKKLIQDYEKKIFSFWDGQKRKQQIMKPFNVINKGMHELVTAFKERD